MRLDWHAYGASARWIRRSPSSALLVSSKETLCLRQSFYCTLLSLLLSYSKSLRSLTVILVVFNDNNNNNNSFFITPKTAHHIIHS